MNCSALRRRGRSGHVPGRDPFPAVTVTVTVPVMPTEVGIHDFGRRSKVDDAVTVMPAQVGIHVFGRRSKEEDADLRRHDDDRRDTGLLRHDDDGRDANLRLHDVDRRRPWPRLTSR
jgi:hypothetical protein